MWRLDNLILKNQWVTEAIKLTISGDKRKWKHNDPQSMGSNFSKRELKKEVLRGKFTAIEAYIREQNSQINHLIYTQRN